MNRWNDKVAIVTGSSAGIGASIARDLVTAGLTVVGLDKRKHETDCNETKNDQKNKFFQFMVDISKEEQVLKTFEWINEYLGPVHVLINNAAIKTSTTLVDGDTSMWKDTLDTNVLGLCIMTREAIKNMREYDVSGHIIHINSTGGHAVPSLVKLNVYPASKFAVTALTETLHCELNSIGSKIKITSISPGCVQTDIFNDTRKDNYERLNGIPVLHPDDISNAVLYTLSTPPHVQVHEMIINPV